jgi:hypothetical protein
MRVTVGFMANKVGALVFRFPRANCHSIFFSFIIRKLTTAPLEAAVEPKHDSRNTT